jgi:processive 1,2-diacylglycerol beta-glucosyltransferase
VVEHVPEFYALMFKKTDDHEKVQKATTFRRRFAHHTNTGFVKFLKQYRPDVVLCPHYLPLEIIGHMREKEERPAPFTVCIVTDFEAHAFWLEPSANFYCVAAEETKGSLVARGVDPSCVAVTGIPISSKFSAKLNQQETRRKYGLRDDLPVLLVLSGGFGMGPVEEILAELDQVDQNFHTVVVAGRNDELRQKLCVQDRTHPTQVLGFTRNMHELMTVADLIVTKPGGLTTSEALAMGKPILVLNPIPGQESANSDFLLEHGAAVKVNRIQDLRFRLQQLLGTKKLQEMSRCAKVLGKPFAAHDICEAVMIHQKANYKIAQPDRAFSSRVEAGTGRLRAKVSS